MTARSCDLCCFLYLLWLKDHVILVAFISFYDCQIMWSLLLSLPILTTRSCNLCCFPCLSWLPDHVIFVAFIACRVIFVAFIAWYYRQIMWSLLLFWPVMTTRSCDLYCFHCLLWLPDYVVFVAFIPCRCFVHCLLWLPDQLIFIAFIACHDCQIMWSLLLYCL